MNIPLGNAMPTFKGSHDTSSGRPSFSDVLGESTTGAATPSGSGTVNVDLVSEMLLMQGLQEMAGAGVNPGKILAAYDRGEHTLEETLTSLRIAAAAGRMQQHAIAMWDTVRNLLLR